MLWLRALLAVLLVAAASGGGPQLDLRQLASFLGSHWQAGRRTGRAGNLGGLLSRSRVILTPKLEITSPNFPPDGGSFFLYADIPFALGGGGPAGTNRNGSVADDTSPATGGETLRNPTVVTSYGRRDGRALLAGAAGFHDVAELVLERLGADGHGCLLRAVCELAARPLRDNGLLGDLVNAAVEIPSTSNATMEEELKVARQLGLKGAPCPDVFSNCNNIIIDKIAK